jgi:hypothetical protein
MGYALGGDGGASAPAGDCAKGQQRVPLRSSPVRAALLALLFPARYVAWLTEDK